MSSGSTKYNFRENAAVLALFFVGVHLLYFKTWQAGFVTDFTGLQERLNGAPFRDFLNCFGFPALHQVTNFFLFLFYKMFGTSALPWYLIYTSLHVVNGFLGYRLVRKVFERGMHNSLPPTPKGEYFLETTNLELKGAREYSPLGVGGRGIGQISTPALIVALLFLFSPYNAEAVIWKVCFNFLFCTAMMLSSLLFLVKYLEIGKKKDVLIAHFLFVVALFTFELALAFPLIALAFFFFWKNGPSGVGLLERSPTPWAVAPYFILSGIYFLLNKIILGGWVGHYGEGVHLNFDIKKIAANCLKYFFKNGIYWREWEHGLKQTFISFSDNPISSYAFIVFGITVLFSGIIFYKKINTKIRTAGFAWVLFFMALAPVANLYVVWLLHGENDRYGYFASLFFYMGLVVLIQFFNKKIKWALYSSFLILSIFNLNKVNTYWQKSTTVVKGLLTDFRWDNNSEIYVLAFPENYKGIPMFKDFSRQNLALKSALKYNADKITKGKFYQVAQFNMSSPDNGLFVKADTGNVIKLEFHEWGSWWWRHGLGAGAYETEEYNFKDVPKGCEVTIKKTASDAVFIYSDGKEWKEVLFLQ